MADSLVLVNGLPGSGKSTLSRSLAARLGATLISKDALKETMAAPGVAATRAMWGLAAESPGLVVLDCWWFRPRDLGFAVAGLRRCGNPPAVEVWCAVPPGVALDRYRSRQRSAIHEDARHLTDSWPRWAAEAAPLEVTPTLLVDTTAPVDLDEVTTRITATLPTPPASARR